jgi:cell division septation protein DedD
MSEFNSDDYLQQRQQQNTVPANFGPVKILATVIVLIGFIYLAWYAYDASEELKDEELPLIAANKEIIKTKPENPGGLIVANRDKDIYDGMSGKNTKKEKKESPVIPPETPASKQAVAQTIEKELKTTEPQTTTEPHANFIVSDKAAESTSTVVEQAKTEPSELDQELNNVEPTSTTTNESTTNANVELQTKVAEATVPENPAPAVAEPVIQPAPQAVNKTYTVRIAALKNEQAAIEAWKSLKATYYSVLGDLGSEIQVVNNGIKTTYYLHAGPIATLEQAEQVCKALQAQGRRCRVY